ncbi:unnamed protein product [Durusdinium trenchii]|uniref:Uncharacterized protein n=2 Tax=Durusdinium trenchii TaxID=1381693 RepID=A0ABP0NMD2_9DINO
MPCRPAPLHARRIPLSARTRWAEPPSIPRPATERKGRAQRGQAQDLLDVLRFEASDTEASESDGVPEEEVGADSRVITSLQRSVGLRGLVAGPMGEGLVTSRMPGFGRGVPPSTRIEQCVAVGFSEAEVRLEGSRFFVLTTAHDGFNLTWLPSMKSGEMSARDDPGWTQVALLPFCSAFSKHEGLAAKGPRTRQASAHATAEIGDPTQTPDVLGEELQQKGLEGVYALIFILAKLFASPQNAFLAMEPENGQVSTLGLENFLRRQIRHDVEALTGLKVVQLFKELDKRENGYISLEDLICSNPENQQQQCTCEEGDKCISEVWKQGGQQDSTEFGRTISPSTQSNHSGADKRKGGGIVSLKTLKWTKQANRRKELTSAATADGRSDVGSQTTRAEIHRRNDLIRKERDSSNVQDTHLDLDRERFITTVQRTTVLHPLDYQVSRRAIEEMESKRRLVQRLAAEAEAAFARKKGQAAGEDLDGAKEDPNPKSLVEMTKGRMRNSVTGSVSLNLDPEMEEPVNFTSVTRSAMAKRLARASAQARQEPQLRRLRFEVSSLVVDPKRPRVAAGIGDGQLAVYYLFRSHGSKRKQLHQIQGFDASRGLGDVCTALCLPAQRLSDEGSMAVETVLAGFESGRVAVFRSFFPEEFSMEKADDKKKKKKKTLEQVMEERQRIKSLANGEPVVQAEEPLLLEHFHCKTPIVALYWHQIMGIFSVSSTGHVVVADSCGVQTFAINEACGRNSTVTSADLSLELEQLAVAGQRGVHLWQILSQAKYGVIGVQDNTQQNPEQNFNVMLVRYMPSGKFLLTLHKEGVVKIWDSRNLELHTSCFAARRVSCAFWEPRWETLFVFNPDGVTEIEIHEDKLETQDLSKTMRMPTLLFSD